MRSWSWHRWVAMLVGTLGSSLLIGIPTDIVPTPLYTRMTPVLWWNYPVWAVSSILSGLILATYVRRQPGVSGSGAGRLTAGGLLSVFAVGCPICNKLVVALLGVTGALNLWAPLQPIVGAISVALLAVALTGRLRGERACPMPRVPQSSTVVDGKLGEPSH